MSISIAMDKSMRSYDGNGHLIVERTIITKADVNRYMGHEIPEYEALGLDPEKIYYLLRDPEELEKALSSFKGVQLLIKHTPVRAEEPRRDLTVGSIGTDIEIDGNDVYASLRVFDKEAIVLIESGKLQELSAGYAYVADMTPGEFNGIPYDGVMRNIHGNHVALVERGRIGPAAVVADHLPIKLMEQSMKLKKGSMPKIMAVLQKIAQDADISQDAAEEVIKTVGDSLEEEPKAADNDTPEKDKAEDTEEPKAEDTETPEDDKPKATDNDMPEDTKKPAMDADAIEAAAVARVTALFEAREAVSPLVGVVAMDSAEAVYGYALKQKGVDIKGVHPSAYKSKVALLKQAEHKPAVAMDAAMPEADELTARFK